MLNNEQSQQGEGNAVNLQAGRDVIVQGITYSDARQIALDVYRANALELQGIAETVAQTRAEHLIDRFLSLLETRGGERLQETASPDFQHCLFEAQKAYARSGDTGVETVLVELLASRANEPSQSLGQVVLNEAVVAVAKLTLDQINLLTIVFLLRHCIYVGLPSQQALLQPIKNVLPMMTSVPDTASVYSYFTYAGVATIQLGDPSLSQILRLNYPGLLSKGIEPSVVESLIASEPLVSKLIGPCTTDPALVQVLAPDEQTLQQQCTLLGLSDQAAFNLANLMKRNLMSDEEVQSLFASLGQFAERLFRVWNTTPMKQIVLTPVGMAIAHANSAPHGLVQADLSVWVN